MDSKTDRILWIMVALLVGLFGPGVFGTAITVAGSWSETINETDRQFFAVRNQRLNVKYQLQLERVSVQIPVDTYTMKIYYTVTTQSG